MRTVVARTAFETVLRMLDDDIPNWEIAAYIRDVLRIEDNHNLKDEIMQCNKCSLRDSNRVPGDGNTCADIMLIGEASGEQEDAIGIPFVGPAGQLLNNIIKAAGWKREELYITNVVKCRPHINERNRQPNVEEIAACIPYLQREIKFVSPKVIICLGSVAANAVIHPNFKITEERGHWFNVNGIRAIATFHPSYILHKGEGTQEQLEAKKAVWSDIKAVNAYLQKG